MQTIGQRVRAAREKHGISQAELARQLHASVNAINMLEQDSIQDPRASRIIGIARTLGVSADYLLGLGPADNDKSPLPLGRSYEAHPSRRCAPARHLAHHALQAD